MRTKLGKITERNIPFPDFFHIDLKSPFLRPTFIYPFTHFQSLLSSFPLERNAQIPNHRNISRNAIRSPLFTTLSLPKIRLLKSIPRIYLVFTLYSPRIYLVFEIRDIYGKYTTYIRGKYKLKGGKRCERTGTR